MKHRIGELKIGKLTIEFHTNWCWGPYWRNCNYFNIGFISIWWPYGKR